jgi:hypothetical protein
MKHLLDFVREHVLDEALYCVLPSAVGELSLQCRRDRGEPLCWEVRCVAVQGPGELVPSSQLLDHLAARGADLRLFEREISAVIAAHIVVSHHLLQDAHALLGPELVQEVLQGHELFARELSRTLAPHIAPERPALKLVRGGGAQSDTRAGHLELVR